MSLTYKKSSPETIQALFATIARRYDLTNTLLTFGLHKRWNRRLIDALQGTTTLLDLCAGTGEIAFGFLKQSPSSKAILLDFCKEMLEVAEIKGSALRGRFELIEHDAQEIPLPDCSVDGISLSYGIRNVKDPERCFKEAYRVLEHKGRLAILELTRPRSKLMQSGHRLYTRLALPLLGKWSTKNREAYHYLQNSVQNFASPTELSVLLRKVGFEAVHCKPLMNGIATLLVCSKC